MINPHLSVVESVHPTPEQVRAIPLFADLDAADQIQISRGLIYKHVPRNEYLFRQGADADSAFFVQSGVLNVVSALPGGGEAQLAKSGPGSMLGETSLVSTGVRTASVKAETDVTGFSMERWFFRSSLAQASPAAAGILSRLIHTVGRRLQSQYAQITAMEPWRNTRVPRPKVADIGPNTGQATKTCSVSYQAFLPRLEFFSNFQPDEINLFESQVRSLELPRNTKLFEKGECPVSSFFVIRGALELYIARANGHVPLAILGPGTFLGTTDILCGGVRTVCGRVREDAVIFEISAGKLLELLSGQSWFALKFQLALCESLIVDLGKINKRVARITSAEQLSHPCTQISR